MNEQEQRKFEELKAILENDGTSIYAVYNNMVDAVDRTYKTSVWYYQKGIIVLKRENGEERKFWYTDAQKGGYHWYLRNIAELTGLDMPEILLLFHRGSFRRI